MIEVLWNTPELPEDFLQDIERAVQTALLLEERRGDVCVRVVDEDEIQALNSAFRQVDAVTDVLTFPAAEGETLLAPPDDYLGDIAICYARAVSQAETLGHSLRRELCFLAVHGALHLCGYDHESPDDDARMCQKQNDILHELGVER